MSKKSPFPPTNKRPQSSPKHMFVESNVTDNKVAVDSGNFTGVSQSISDKLSNNDDIQVLFPEIELSMDILTASVLSPNDMVSTNLTYSMPDTIIPSEVNGQILSVIKSHMVSNYDIEEGMGDVFKEAHFKKGAHIVAVISDGAIAELSDNVARLSTESTLSEIGNTVASATVEDKFLKSSTTVECRLSDFNTSKEIKTNGTETITISDEELGVEVISNISSILLPEVYKNKVAALNQQEMGIGFDLGAGELSTEAATYRRDLRRKVVETGMLRLSAPNDSKYESIGRPTIVKIPVEAFIPIHTTNDPSDHIGGILLLDKNNCMIGSSDYDLKELNQEQVDIKSVLIQKAKTALHGATKKDVTIDNIDEIYNKLMMESIRKKLDSGLYQGLGEIDEHPELFRVMFNRSLHGLKTRMLFLPKEVVSYIAFDYRSNGTGRSLIEKGSVLFSMRAMLLLARVKSELKNSIPGTLVSVELDPDSVDPEGDKEKIISEYMKSEQVKMPLGTTNVSSLSNWTNYFGARFIFKHPLLPDMEVSVDDEQRGISNPDTDLMENLEDQTNAILGVTTDLISRGRDGSLATKIISDNVLLAKRVTVLQRKLENGMCGRIKRIMSADRQLKNKIMGIIEANYSTVTKTLKQKLTHIDKETLNNMVKDQVLMGDMIFAEYCESITIKLPSIDMHEDVGTKEALDNFISSVDEYLPMIISDESFPEEIVGRFSENMEALINITRSVLIRKWMNDNNFMPELSNLVTLDRNGNPTMDVLAEHDNIVKNLTKAVLPILKKLKKAGRSTDNKLDKMEEDEPEEVESTPEGSGDDQIDDDLGGGDTDVEDVDKNN